MAFRFGRFQSYLFSFKSASPWKLLNTKFDLEKATVMPMVFSTGIKLYHDEAANINQERLGKPKELREDSLPTWFEGSSVVKKDDLKHFYEVLPQIINDVVNLPLAEHLPLANEKIRELMEYSVSVSPFLGVATMASNRFYIERRRKNNLVFNEQEYWDLAYRFGWIAEMLTSHKCILDDIADGGQERYNLRCWHTLSHVGRSAIYDGCQLATGAYLLISKYFKDKPYFVDLLGLVHEANYALEIGENEILLSFPRPGLNELDIRQKKQYILARKMSGYYLYFPMAATMLMHDVGDPRLMKLVKDTMLYMTHYFVMTDDLADCFGNAQVNERIGNDVEMGKNSFVLWKALELANPLQCRHLKAIYGRREDVFVNQVKDIYQELNVLKFLVEEADEMASRLKAQISKLPQDDLPCQLWLSMIDHYRDMSHGKTARV